MLVYILNLIHIRVLSGRHYHIPLNVGSPLLFSSYSLFLDYLSMILISVCTRIAETDPWLKWVRKVNGRRQWRPTPVLLPGKSQGQRSLVGFSPWGRTELDTTEQLHFHFSLSCIGEENGNPLQCSCLENPRDGGAWWAAIYGVAQSWTRLKRLSSSSSSSRSLHYIVYSQRGLLPCWTH